MQCKIKNFKRSERFTRSIFEKQLGGKKLSDKGTLDVTAALYGHFHAATAVLTLQANRHKFCAVHVTNRAALDELTILAAFCAVSGFKKGASRQRGS
jgi:hypothetical protein